MSSACPESRMEIRAWKLAGKQTTVGRYGREAQVGISWEYPESDGGLRLVTLTV